MAGALRVTMAIDRYDRHFPLFDRTVTPPAGVELNTLQVGQGQNLRDGNDRHERMMAGEFDVAEFSMSTFLMARARGVPLIGIPVFSRRLFSQSQIWVRPDSNMWHPKDLIGKRVAVSAFQTTLSLLTKGDLRFYYDVPWEKIYWLVTTQEKVKFEPKGGVKIDFIGGREDLGRLLENGTIDAFFLPHPPHSISSGATKARRRFADCRAEEAAYYRKVGDFPIMHVLVIRQDLLDKAPGIAKDLLNTFDRAWAIAKSYYDDPNWARLAWGRHDFEEERALFTRDPWQNGFAFNKANIERFIRYSQDQGLISEVYPAETLFAPSTLDT